MAYRFLGLWTFVLEEFGDNVPNYISSLDTYVRRVKLTQSKKRFPFQLRVPDRAHNSLPPLSWPVKVFQPAFGMPPVTNRSSSWSSLAWQSWTPLKTKRSRERKIAGNSADSQHQVNRMLDPN